MVVFGMRERAGIKNRRRRDTVTCKVVARDLQWSSAKVGTQRDQITHRRLCVSCVARLPSEDRTRTNGDRERRGRWRSGPGKPGGAELNCLRYDTHRKHINAPLLI